MYFRSILLNFVQFYFAKMFRNYTINTEKTAQPCGFSFVDANAPLLRHYILDTVVVPETIENAMFYQGRVYFVCTLKGT